MKLAAVLLAGLLFLGLVNCRPGQAGVASEQLDQQQRQLATELKDVTKNYLVQQFGETGFGGKSFCAFKLLDIEQKGDDVNEYVYTVCQEYYLKNDELKQGTGSGLPVALQLRKEGASYKVISHKAPGDGARYSRDIEEFFPKKTHAEIFAAGSDYKSWKEEVENEARNYFRK